MYIYLLCIISLLSFTYMNNNYSQIRDSSFPYISGDSFRALANHIFDETNKSLNPKDIKYKDIIFVKTDYLNLFFTKIHPNIQQKYILITHNSDDSAPGKFEHYVYDKKILYWFGQNPTIMNNEKFIPIPIGIANRCWSHGNIDVFNKTLKNLYIEKNYLLGINFRVGTAPSIRNEVFNFFSNKSFCKNLYSEKLEIYLQNMSEAKFILSPAGNGLDCHRTWEALLMGAIPILKTSMLDELLLDLPILIIKDWHEVTEEFLEKKSEEIKNNFHNYNLAKIYFLYWQKLIEFYRDKLS
ncbi:MAG: hypothetical protein WDZ41_03585 [Candidatus Babeliales bacterium]